MHPKSFVGRAPPGPAAGAYSAPPDPLLILRKGRREMGKGGKEGEGRASCLPPPTHNFWLRHCWCHFNKYRIGTKDIFSANLVHVTSCAARWPPQYAPAPADRRPTCLPMCVPNLKIIAFSVCEISRGSQNFEIGARAPGDAQFRANLWSGRKNCPRPMCMPNLKIVAFSVCEILRGSQNFEIAARTPGDAQFRANLWSGTRTAHCLCACQI